MGKSDQTIEERVLSRLIEAVDEIEIYTKKVDYKVFENILGFFFARVLDNKVTSSEKGEKEYESVITRAAAFIIVTQMFCYLILNQEITQNFDKIDAILDTRQIQSYFDEIISDKRYEIIYRARLVEILPEESISTLKSLFLALSSFKLNKIKADILGKIFHSLIPFELRKFLAAYYTSNVVSEFLSYLTIKNAYVSIMDPACGSGTLLVSAYKRVKEINKSLEHHQILQNIFGVDVSLFAGQLAGINLALQEPMNSLDKSQISFIDIFKLEINTNQNTDDFSFTIPKIDILLGNPPFTRGDRLDSEYKDFLAAHLHRHGISLDYHKKYLGLYAYFLLDSLRLLKDNGKLAFILPISMINSLTMKPVIQFLLEEYYFQYFITSDAQVAFSEQCAFKEILFIAQRAEQQPDRKTKFVVLKKKLSMENYISLARTIEESKEDYEDSSIRIRHVEKKDLCETVMLNWVVYFYNPSFFKLFEEISKSDIVSPIKQIVDVPRYDVDRGLRAGVSDFFYLPNKFWKIIDESKSWIQIQNKEDNSILKMPSPYLFPVLRKSSLYNRITPEVSEYIVVVSDDTRLEKPVKEYIHWGVDKFQKQQGFETLAYNHINQGRKIARVGITQEISLNSNKFVAFYSPTPLVLTDNFIFIRTFDEEKDKVLAAYLNSSVYLLTYFVLRREKTGPLGQVFGSDVRNFVCLNPHKVTKVDSKELIQIFDRFIQESGDFTSFYSQIQEAMTNRNNTRFLLDTKICEILMINDIPVFLRQLYETLSEELNKFK